MSEYWERTQEMLQPLITKPQLTEKYLKKPPFRFLHDIFTALTKATGLGEGLLEGPELDTSALENKSDKVAVLKKIIKYVDGIVPLGEPVEAKAMVGGKDPEKTNAFLQALATAAKCEPEKWQKSLEKVKKSQPPPPPPDDSATPPPPPPPPDDIPPPPPPPEEPTSTEEAPKAKPAKPSMLRVDTSSKTNDLPKVKDKPKEWPEIKMMLKELRDKAENIGTMVEGVSVRSNKELGSEILEVQRDLKDTERVGDVDPPTPKEDEDIEDCDKLQAEIEAQLDALKQTTELMAANEHMVEQLMKYAIP